MKKQNLWKNTFYWLYRIVCNPYALVLLVFGVVMLFFGEQSYRQHRRRAKQIEELRQQVAANKAVIEEENRVILQLQDSAELERYAREHYFMHTKDEDVYQIEK